ncbi:MAG TPA: hypothetical protein VNO79_06935 [Actinomycetota bacterium]|nr:hypothetical protein [Actinomycetota bacterium]
MARPTKLSPEVQARICQAIRAGNYRETAARYAGIGISTFYAWLQRGERAAEELARLGELPRRALLAEARARGLKLPRRAKTADLPRLLLGEEAAFLEFRDAVERALVEAEVADVALIERAAQEGHWQAAAWRLERMFPDRWGRRRIEHTGEDGGPIRLALQGLTDEELDDALSRLLEASEA